MQATVALRPDKESVSPALLLQIQLKYRSDTDIPLGVHGLLRSGDKRPLRNFAGLNYTGGQREIHANYSNSSKDHEITGTTRIELTDRDLEYIERLRHRTPKGDAQFVVNVNCDILRPMLQIRNLSRIGANTGAGAQPVGVNQNTNESTADRDLAFIAGQGQIIGYRDTYTQALDVSISASDWIHDFVPNLGGNTFVVFEIPRAIPKEESSDFGPRIEAARVAINNANEARIRGDWEEVCSDLRPVWEVFKDKTELGAFLKGCGYPDDAAENMAAAQQGFFGFASKLVHATDTKKKIKPSIHVDQEDALLSFAFATAFVNLIARKSPR